MQGKPWNVRRNWKKQHKEPRYRNSMKSVVSGTERPYPSPKGKRKRINMRNRILMGGESERNSSTDNDYAENADYGRFLASFTFVEGKRRECHAD